MPMRLQRQRTKGWRKPDGVVHVGRGTRWGNPFRVADSTAADKHAQHAQVVAQFRVSFGTG